MARNGSGTYSLPTPQNPVVEDTPITTDWANTTLTDIGTEITNSIDKGGRTTPTANLPMGNFKHTDVGNASARTQYTSAAQVQDGSITYLTGVSGTNTITATAPLSMEAYVAGQVFQFVSSGANTSTVTLNINSIGAKAITKAGATVLVANDIASGAAVEVVYDGTQFQLVGAPVPVSVIRDERTSNTILGVGDKGKFVDITSGTFTQTFDACATLGNGWYVWLRNSGTGDITLDPNASETIDGLASFLMYSQEVRLIQCNGTNLISAVLHPFSRTFTASGTFTKPPGYGAFFVENFGAGGGGGSGRRGSAGSTRSGGGGGGGGSYTSRTINASDVGTTETVTIGAGGNGGAAIAVNDTNGNAGTAGGNTTFGSLLIAYGGLAGAAGTNTTVAGGAGAGVLGVGSGTSGGAPRLAGVTAQQFGGGDSAAASNGQPSAHGGGGGGGGGAASGANGAEAGTSYQGGPGGGGGGGVDSGNSAGPGAAGGGITGTAGGGGAGGATGTAGTAGSGRQGGGGGGGGSGGNGGAGGDGGIPGSGGGGGGGCVNGNTANAGGSGARGECRIKGVA